jgi:NhaP-type Na+/H+ or K+/H+ antiporter
LHQEEPPGGKQIFIVAWTGMRGVLALAAAISLPTVLQNGAPFPQRNVIIFLTFCVIFATLVLQGLTLPAVIRKLGLSAGGDPQPGRAAGPSAHPEHGAGIPEDLSRQAKSEHAPFTKT